jgi:hypothetical protein
MQNQLLQIFSKMSQRALEKSRRYYYPYALSDTAQAEDLSDAEFAAMLQEIDRFTAQFARSPPLEK